MANNTKLIPCHVSLEKLVTLAELGLGVERPLNAEKRKWIKKLTKETDHKPILVTPIKDSGYYILADGWHRVQAAKKKKQKTICLLYTSPSPRDRTRSRMPSSA